MLKQLLLFFKFFFIFSIAALWNVNFIHPLLLLVLLPNSVPFVFYYAIVSLWTVFSSCKMIYKSFEAMYWNNQNITLNLWIAISQSVNSRFLEKLSVVNTLFTSKLIFIVCFEYLEFVYDIFTILLFTTLVSRGEHCV